MRQLLPFKVGYENYALDLIEIQEIVENRTVYPYPASPNVVGGVIDFHGRIVPVIDMPVMLEMTTGTIGQRLIVLINDRGPMALGVDQVGAIVSLESAKTSPIQNYAERKYIREIINWGGSMINLLDLDQVKAELDRLCENGGA